MGVLLLGIVAWVTENLILTYTKFYIKYCIPGTLVLSARGRTPVGDCDLVTNTILLADGSGTLVPWSRMGVIRMGVLSLGIVAWVTENVIYIHSCNILYVLI